MSVYKSGLDMLRCLLRLTSKWKYDSFIWTQTSSFYKISCSAALSQSGRKNTHGHSLKQVRFYTQNSQDSLGFQVKQTAPSIEAIEVSDKPKRISFAAHLKKCSCPTDVLDAVKQFPTSRNHISSIFICMRESTKVMTREQENCELQLMFEHPGFQEVCEWAVTDAWRMRHENLVYTLLAIIKLGVPQNTEVVQTLLRVIQERLNQFDLQCLSAVAGAIQNMEDSKNVQALREALGLLLKYRIPEVTNVVILQNMMRAMGKNSPKELKMQLATKALSLADKFNPPNTQYVFVSLAAMDLKFNPLLKICSKSIAENVQDVPFNRLLKVLMSCHQLQYRNYTLFNAISIYIASMFEMWSNKNVILLILMFKDLTFRPVQILDAFAERVIQKPESLTLKDLFSVLKVFSFFNHDLKERNTQFWASITKVLESYLPRMSPYDLLKVNYYLALMEQFHPTLLEKLMQQETLDQLLQKEKPSNNVLRWLHMVNLCLRLDKPQLLSSLSSIPHLNITVPASDPTVDHELLSLVRRIVGKHAVQECVMEQGTHFIDCVITLPGEKEDSASPERTQRIAMICTSHNSYCYSTSHPLSSLVIKLRHLEKLGYKPVLVPVNELGFKTEQEKIVKLKQLIFSAPESSESLHNSPKTEDIV